MGKANERQSVLALSAPAPEGSTAVGRLVGGFAAGGSELFLFHPVDTIAKRLMVNQTHIMVKGDMNQTMTNMNNVIFRQAANENALNKFKSMFPGLGFAAGYKIAQRTYKFGGQPYVNDYIKKNYGPSIANTFGDKSGRVLTAGVAGAIMGVGEIALLPLDVLKIKAQTNPDVLKGRGVVEIFMTEGRGLYRGAGWTAARNAPGSFALFGGSAVIHHAVFGNDRVTDATFFQNFVASIAGSVASITVAAPLDVIKTRVQNKPFDAPESGVQIVRNIIRDEGMGAFFKGLGPKILVVGPKLIFSYTIAQHIMGMFSNKKKTDA